jgi:hypothetical protein
MLWFGISTGPLFTYILIFIAIVFAISAFLPPPWNQFCREIFYIGLFICILSLELSVFNTAFTTLKPPEVTLLNCTTLFGTKEKPTEAWDAIAVWSRVTTGHFPSTAMTLLSFIIAMYAARQLFGFFLLDFYGYGAWGIAGGFGAAMFILFLRNIMEKWFIIEEIAVEARSVLETEIKREEAVKDTFKKEHRPCIKDFPRRPSLLRE